MRSIAVALVLFSLVACDDDPEPAMAPPETYVTMTDAELTAALDAAKASAAANDRRILLDFGADWCPDCREVLRLSHEPAMAALLAEKYETIVIDVGRFDQHTELLERYGIERIATLVVLDANGEKVAQTTLEPITGDAEGLTGEMLAGWLRNPTENWQP
ncbi:MAG: thioredoxin family protein [Deltaproteobacteria bacterium]|nr:thioredoxin family protein [Deltaproteobacteria bacterium]